MIIVKKKFAYLLGTFLVGLILGCFLCLLPSLASSRAPGLSGENFNKKIEELDSKWTPMTEENQYDLSYFSDLSDAQLANLSKRYAGHSFVASLDTLFLERTLNYQYNSNKSAEMYNIALFVLSSVILLVALVQVFIALGLIRIQS